MPRIILIRELLDDECDYDVNCSLSSIMRMLNTEKFNLKVPGGKSCGGPACNVKKKILYFDEFPLYSILESFLCCYLTYPTPYLPDFYTL